MTEKPILFSAPMVRAILDGRKTVTRRALKLRGYKTFTEFQTSDITSHHWTFRRPDKCWCDYTNANLLKLLPIQVGDTLWVREAFYETDKLCSIGFGGEEPCPYVYRADLAEGDWKFARWTPSIFMPRAASRITLRVTAVKVERLQDISESDAKAEGVTLNQYEVGCPEGGSLKEEQPIRDFAILWTSINGPHAWEAKPWVAAYSFERVK